MSTQNSDCYELTEETNNSEMIQNDASHSTKLERRRRIEELFEEKRLRKELGDFDMM